MSGQGRRIIEKLYASAEKPEDLPWHETDPPEQLLRAMEARESPGRALDIGCGSGTLSIYMAERGYEVTAIDYMPKAIAMLKASLAGSNLSIDAVQADVNQWKTDEPFDIVLDRGCLHTPGTIDYDTYKKQLLQWLAPGGDFILLHMGKRGWWDYWPVGPKRVDAQTLFRLFEPEITLVEDGSYLLENMPMFLGRTALAGRYWFRRNR